MGLFRDQALFVLCGALWFWSKVAMMLAALEVPPQRHRHAFEAEL